MATVSESEPKKLVPIHIAHVGSFKGHPSGPFTLSVDVFDEIVRNFNADGIPIPIDAEHASEAPATEGSIPAFGAPAMGWIHSLENRGQAGLWGMVEWLEPARTYIKEGRYRYLSPAVRFNSRNRISGQPTGARLTSAAITNQPFLKSLASLVAKDDAGRRLTLMTSRDLLEFEEDDDDSDNDEDDEDDPASAAGQTPEEGDDPMDPKDTQLKDANDKIVVLTDRYTMAEQKAKEAEKLIVAKDAEITALKGENAALLNWKAEREEADQKAEVDAAYETYKDARKLTDNQKSAMLSFLKAAPEAFRTMYPPVPAAQRHLLRNVANDGPGIAKGAMQTGHVTLSERTRQLMEERKLPFDVAQREASKEFRGVFTNGGR